MDARQHLIRVLAKSGMPGGTPRANEMVDAFAHELAEKIRRKCHELYGSPTALRPGLWADKGYRLLDAADLIDPKEVGPELPTCPYTHAHTRHWCGYSTCRES